MPYRFYNIHPRHLFVDDCTKRSIALTTGLDYKLVAKGLNEHKRVTGVKTYYDPPNPYSYVESVLSFPRVKMTRRAGATPMIAEAFALRHPVGRYILSLSGHWVACIDGVLFDTWDCSGEEVLSYYEITRFVRTRVEKKHCFCTERKSKNLVLVTVYDGNGQYATRNFCEEEARKYKEQLYQRGFFNFDEMGEYI